MTDRFPLLSMNDGIPSNAPLSATDIWEERKVLSPQLCRNLRKYLPTSPSPSHPPSSSSSRSHPSGVPIRDPAPRRVLSESIVRVFPCEFGSCRGVKVKSSTRSFYGCPLTEADNFPGGYCESLPEPRSPQASKITHCKILHSLSPIVKLPVLLFHRRTTVGYCIPFEPHPLVFLFRRAKPFGPICSQL